jgi:hypothetical protein
VTGGLFPVAITNASRYPGKPVSERSFAAVASQTQICLDENILNQLFVNLVITTETPKYSANMFLMPLDQTPVRI